ncbi:hypothetical protein N7474_005698 [Penicillium riverlandense]|uniref:uncharacterized protein n=1 Tax=Penicillium riverlandense TaxID=1903569 RepID=UPI0025491F4C|nr:uncharacterized protein N7474_005698 [Penicillium riverlandense]KAJ5820107.1 hypothetical protein N7474_005698 [Penicillium riverlandense]
MAGNIGNFACEVASGDCSLSIDDIAQCTGGDKQNVPIIDFALYASRNLFDWNEGIQSLLDDDLNQFQSNAMQIVLDFTTHDISGVGSESDYKSGLQLIDLNRVLALDLWFWGS